MKLQRSTLILAFSALILGGAYWIYEAQILPRQEAAKTESEKLFTFEEAEVQQLKIALVDQQFEFVRQANGAPSPSPSPASSAETAPNTPETSSATTAEDSIETSDNDVENPAEVPGATSGWRMLAPAQKAANEASIAFLLNLMVTETSSQTLTISADRQAEFGFDSPLAIVEVTLADQTRHRLILGASDFDQTGLYAQVDPVNSNPNRGENAANGQEADQSGSNELTIYLVPISFESAVARPITEWEEPPPPPPEPSIPPELSIPPEPITPPDFSNGGETPENPGEDSQTLDLSPDSDANPGNLEPDADSPDSELPLDSPPDPTSP